MNSKKKPHVTPWLFLSWNTKGEVRKKVNAALFHTMKADQTKDAQ